MDPHWRPQSCSLVPTMVPYDFIGSLENFDADLAHILRRIFPDRAVPIRDHKPHRTDSAEKLAQYYGPEELRLAHAIYERDFGELGYDLDIASPSRRTPTPRPDSRIIKAWGRACRLMSERDFAAAEREFMALRPWISGVAVDEQLLHCRCELKGSDRAAIKENVASLEAALARGQEEWSVWKWYGHGLVRIGRWEDGLQAMLSATERQPRGNHRIKRTRRLVWRLALLRASKGRLQEALATLSNIPVRTDGASWSAALDRFRRLTLRVVATVAVMIGAPKWHPDRVMGIPHAEPVARPSGAAASG